MYTWGYLKNAILAKLDLEEDEAMQLNYVERFPFYANEVITMICSTVKPKKTFYEFVVDVPCTTITMPDDFVSFGDDRNIIDGYTANDENFEYFGYNQLYCISVGTYRISYNARWYTFTLEDDDVYINVPADVLDCIPTYVASQCMKVDDEQKAAVLRNEFEIMFARIDDSTRKSNGTFVIGGDW